MNEFIVLAAIVKVIVDRVKSRFAGLDGDLITGAAAVAGIALSFVFKIDVANQFVGGGLDPILSYVVSGIGIGLGAGFLNDTLAAVSNAGSL